MTEGIEGTGTLEAMAAASDCLEADFLIGGENSSILALFGGTSGPGVSAPVDSRSARHGNGAVEVGIMRGARVLGDSGRLGSDSSSCLGVALRIWHV